MGYWLLWADLVSSCSGMVEGCGCSQSGLGHSQKVLLVLGKQTLQFQGWADGCSDLPVGGCAGQCPVPVCFPWLGGGKGSWDGGAAKPGHRERAALALTGIVGFGSIPGVGHS